MTQSASRPVGARSGVPRRRARMTGTERREQLIAVGRELFAERGFEATSVEEIAARARVSKPVVYEHFGGKEGLYAVVVDRETNQLLGAISRALGSSPHARVIVERAALALLDYIENSTAGFRVLVRDSPVAQSTGSFASLLSDIASEVERILVPIFRANRLDPATAPMYAQMLVGAIAYTGQWWLQEREPSKQEVAAHIVNLVWRGLPDLDQEPRLVAHQVPEATSARRNRR